MIDKILEVITSIIGVLESKYSNKRQEKIDMYDKRYEIYSKTLNIFKKSVSGDVLECEEIKEFVELHNKSKTILQENVYRFLSDVFSNMMVIDNINLLEDEYIRFSSEPDKHLMDICKQVKKIETSDELKRAIDSKELSKVIGLKETILDYERDRKSEYKIELINTYKQGLFERLESYKLLTGVSSLEEIKSDLLNMESNNETCFGVDMDKFLDIANDFITHATIEYLPKYSAVFQSDLEIR